jgi:hypothetical protein
MGPGARRNALDDHFNDWNHKKIVGLGKFLLERVKKAVDNMTTCRLELLETELGLPREAVGKWTREMELWELDDGNPNPFKIAEKHEGIFAIRGRLVEEASTAVVGDAADDVRGDLHAHKMVDMGMQLEQQQRDLAFDAGAVKLHATDRQKTALVERSNKLGRKVNEWLKIRESFAPVVARLRSQEDEARAAAVRLKPTPTVPVHATQLWLPSKLTTVKPPVAVKQSHARFEFELRVGSWASARCLGGAAPSAACPHRQISLQGPIRARCLVQHTRKDFHPERRRADTTNSGRISSRASGARQSRSNAA